MHALKYDSGMIHFNMERFDSIQCPNVPVRFDEI